MAEKMRTISFIDEFINEGGCFKAFADFVRNHDELELLFRGNSSDVAIVYYCNNIVWKLSKKDNIAKVTVNYNHLRYCSNWPQIIAEKYHKLYGFPLVTEDDITEKYDLSAYHDSEIDVSKGEKFDIAFVSGLYSVIEEVMADFFFPYLNDEKAESNDPRLMDHFRDKKDGKQRIRKNGIRVKKPNYLEKQNQQAYFSSKCMIDNGVYIYDLEYKEPYASKKAKEAALKAKGREKMNKPDCLGIRFIDKKPVSFVMVEMKSKAGAEIGPSGTEEHLDGMWDDLLDPQFLKSRLREAHALMEAYRMVRLHGLNGDEVIPTFDDIECGEILVVYTDELAKGKSAGMNKAQSEKYPDGIPYTIELFQMPKTIS